MRFGIGDAFIEQPGAHLVVALEPQPGREEALTDEPGNARSPAQTSAVSMTVGTAADLETIRLRVRRVVVLADVVAIEQPGVSREATRQESPLSLRLSCQAARTP